MKNRKIEVFGEPYPFHSVNEIPGGFHQEPQKKSVLAEWFDVIFDTKFVIYLALGLLVVMGGLALFYN